LFSIVFALHFIIASPGNLWIYRENNTKAIINRPHMIKSNLRNSGKRYVYILLFLLILNYNKPLVEVRLRSEKST